MATAPVQLPHRRHVAHPVAHRHMHPPRLPRHRSARLQRGGGGGSWSEPSQMSEPSQLQLQWLGVAVPLVLPLKLQLQRGL